MELQVQAQAQAQSSPTATTATTATATAADEVDSASEGETRSEAPRKYQCPACPSSFKRRGHLMRHHQSSHDGGRRFACDVCGKKFARSDILVRHEATHAQPAQVELMGMSVSGRRGIGIAAAVKCRGRACGECARAREKCTRGLPCLRCSQRGMDCVYPRAKPRFGRPSDLQVGSSSSPNGIDSETFAAEVDADDPMDGDPGNTPRLLAEGNHDGSATNMLDPPLQTFTEMPASHPQPVLGGVSSQPMYDVFSDFPINWLPVNDAVEIDYSSILGLGSSEQFSALTTTYPAPGPQTQTYPAFGSAATVPVSDSQGPANHGAYSAASPAQTMTSASRTTLEPASPSDIPNGLYATSTDGGRAPCTVRSKPASLAIYNGSALEPVEEAAHPEGSAVLGFPDVHHIMTNNESEPHSRHSITAGTYHAILHSFEQLCLRPDDLLFPAGTFRSKTFPSLAHVNLFIRLYFERFDPILSLVHSPTTNLDENWRLALAVASIGCQYTRTREFSRCVLPMHEFLDRVVTVALLQRTSGQGGCQQDPHNSREAMQVLVLGQIAMLYYGHPRHMDKARMRHGLLVRMLEETRILSGWPNSTGSAWRGHDAGAWTWKQGVELETERRLGYAIWLVDCMSAYHFGCRSLLTLDVACAPLPNDELWAAPDSRAWRIASEAQRREPPSLVTAVHALFARKEVWPGISESSHVLLLHGVYQQYFHVRAHLASPLSRWKPAAQTQTQAQTHSHTQTNGHDHDHNHPDDTTLAVPGLDAVPEQEQGGQRPRQAATGGGQVEVASWRNASLDCVDVLHWSANGTIARLSGSEHPTVFHLHMSRLVLLAPHESVQVLARSIASSSLSSSSSSQAGTSTARTRARTGDGQPERMSATNPKTPRAPTREETMEAEMEVLQWAQRDEHKARLCMVHCGCLLWHARRYSTMAFYEPVSVYLATLVMWAYGTYAAKTPAAQQPLAASLDPAESSAGAPLAPPAQYAQYNAHGTSQAQAAAVPQQPDSSHSSSHIDVLQLPRIDVPEVHSIRLDRPCDDELVCIYVRRGRPALMQATVTGVGDVCSAHGPWKMLREGRKLLNGIALAWGRTDEYVAILAAVEERARGQVEGLPA